MVTIIANQLDNNYSQVQINALYTQCKKLIEDPFDFVVFVQDDEMDLLMSTKKMDGYIEGIEFHVPKYGLDWLEIDIMKHTKPNSRSLFITPNTIINNIEDIDIYKANKRVRLQDGNLAYFIFRNDNVEKILRSLAVVSGIEHDAYSTLVERTLSECLSLEERAYFGAMEAINWSIDESNYFIEDLEVRLF
mgnify:CR=1 FL=1